MLLKDCFPAFTLHRNNINFHFDNIKDPICMHFPLTFLLNVFLKTF